MLSRKLLEVVLEAATTPIDPDSPDSFDAGMVQEVAPAVDWLCRLYFRQDVEGIDAVPRGKTLIVANHNMGITTVELLGMGGRWYAERGLDEPIYGLAHDAIIAMPFLGNFLVHAGAVRANHENAAKVFERGHKILVAPGGNLEAFRPYRDRNRVDLQGRKGFIRLALRHSVPITPVVLIGGHETFFVLHDGRFIAKLLGLKKLLRAETWPLMLALPWGVAFAPIFHLPLPAKCSVRFLEPISLEHYTPADADNPEALQEIYDVVTGRMQAAMDHMASRRRWPIIG